MRGLARLTGALAMVAAAASVIQMRHEREPSPAAPAATASPQEPSSLSSAALAWPALQDTAGAALLDRSPFVADRSAYRRPSRAAPPPTQTAPPRRTVRVTLIAIVRDGEATRAVLLIDGVERTVQPGDRTAAGEVEEVSGAAVTIKTEAGVKRLDLFGAPTVEVAEARGS